MEQYSSGPAVMRHAPDPVVAFAQSERSWIFLRSWCGHDFCDSSIWLLVHCSDVDYHDSGFCLIAPRGGAQCSNECSRITTVQSMLYLKSMQRIIVSKLNTYKWAIFLAHTLIFLTSILFPNQPFIISQVIIRYHSMGDDRYYTLAEGTSFLDYTWIVL